MQKSIIRLFILLSAFIITERSSSQTIISDTSELREYFMDPGSEAKNVFKINLTSFLSGDLPVYYERVLTKQFSIEAGVGVILPFYVFEGSNIYSDEQIITNPDGGYSLWIHPKLYFWRAPEGMYFGLQYRYRKYLQDNAVVRYSDYTINYGYQWILGTHFVLDANIGAGFRIRNIPDDFYEWEDEFIKTTLVVPFGIRFGVLF